MFGEQRVSVSQPAPPIRKLDGDPLIVLSGRYPLIAQYPQAAKLWQKGGLFEQGRTNIIAHQVLTAYVGDRLESLMGHSEKERRTIVNALLTHDWDKFQDLQSCSVGMERTDRSGNTIVEIDRVKNLQNEMARKKGQLRRVTGLDWRDFDRWGMPEYVVRYADSSVEMMPDGSERIVPWRQRVRHLQTRRSSPEIDQMFMDIYGMAPFQKLEKLMMIIEKSLHQQILDKNPNLRNSYPTPDHLYRLLRMSPAIASLSIAQ